MKLTVIVEKVLNDYFSDSDKLIETMEHERQAKEKSIDDILGI